MTDRNRIGVYLLIAALAFVFAWFGVDKFVNPLLWTGFLPTWMDGLFGISKTGWMPVLGAIEIAFAVMLLVPARRVRQLGALFIAMHLGFVVWQVGWNDVGVRDIGLLLSSLALLALL